MAMLPRDTVSLSPEQFDKLVELLTPGYEMAKAYQAEMASRAAERAEYEPQPKIPAGDDASKIGDSKTPMDQGSTGFRKSAPPPDFDDASKQGSG